MAQPVRIPEVGESIREVTVASWRHAVGDRVARDEPLVEIESEKATLELPSPFAGVLTRITKQVGETVAVGDVVGEIDESQTEAQPPPAAPATTSPGATPASPQSGAPPTVMVPPVPPPPPSPPVPAAQPIAPTSAGLAEGQTARQIAPRERIVPMSQLRRTVARRLVEAQQTSAILTTFNEIDMTRLMSIRDALGERFQKQHGVKLGVMSFFIKAAIEALKAFPALNAEIRDDDIVFKDHYDIGVAVGGGKGLVVPVVRDADALSFAELEKSVASLAARAREGHLGLEELEGGTFTISNGGIYGSLLSTPILNPPQSGILGLHKIEKRPVAVGDQVVVRPMMYVALSYDHRIVDGREAVLSLARVKDCVEEPERILLET